MAAPRRQFRPPTIQRKPEAVDDSSAGLAFRSPARKRRRIDAHSDEEDVEVCRGSESTLMAIGAASGAEEAYYSCTWRKPQARKHKTWDGDGVLCIMGSRCVLRDADTQKDLASGRWTAIAPVTAGDQLTVGGLELEIESYVEKPGGLLSRQSSIGKDSGIGNCKVGAKQGPSKGHLATASFKAPTVLTAHPVLPCGPSSPPRVKVGQALVSAMDQPNSTDAPVRVFACMHRVPQKGKKTQTWTYDGVISLFGDGKAVLRDSSNGRQLAATSELDPSVWAEGCIARLGNREVEVGAEIMQDRGQRETTATSAVDVDGSANWPRSFKDPIFGGHRSAQRGAPASVLVPRFDATAPGAIMLKRPDEAWQRQHNPKGLPVVDVVIDPLLSERLRPHQIKGAHFLYECTMGMQNFEGQGCLLADDMGLGKTVTAITLMWTLLRQNPLFGAGPVIERAMIVCPVTLIKNWAREIYKWLGKDRIQVFIADAKANLKLFALSKTFKVLIIGYERLRTAAQELKSIFPPIGLVIADEGHRLKTAGAKTTQALRLFKTPRRVILSGTPIQNRLEEFFHMCDYLCSGILDDYSTFKRTFEVPILRSREPTCSKAQKEIGDIRSDQLARLANSFVLRRTSDVIADYLPPRVEFCIFVAPTSIQLQLYAAILESPEVRDIFAGLGGQNLVLINTLKKLCNSALLVSKELPQDFASLGIDKLSSPAVVSGKLTVVNNMLSQLKQTNEKIVLVSNYTSTLDVLEDLCSARGYTYCRLDGSTPQNQRDDIVQQFNKSSRHECFVFLLSSKSGGVGLNLIGASRLLLFDPDWNPAVDHQSMARIWRQGQKNACFIYRLFCTGTIEESILQRQVTKRGLAGDLIQDSAKAGSKAGDAFSLEELKALFRLRTDTACATHDLLGCSCLTSDDDPAEADGACSDEEEAPGNALTFLSASQLASQPPEGKMGPPRKKLADLRNWIHVDCRDPSSVDEIGDAILVSTIDECKRTKAPWDDELEMDCSEQDMIHGGEITFVFSKVSSNLEAATNPPS